MVPGSLSFCLCPSDLSKEIPDLPLGVVRHGVWWGDVRVLGCAREQDAKHSLEEEHRGLVSASLFPSCLILIFVLS